MRLQTYISHSGLCSRRQAMELVKQAQITVNGSVITEPSFDIEPGKDVVMHADKKLKLKDHIYLMLNKPLHITTTRSDQHAERTVMELIPAKYQHLYPVGRLDRETAGLLLLTNHGELAHRLMHPRFEISKIYEVLIQPQLTLADKKILENGFQLEGKRTAPTKIKLNRSDPGRLTINLHEGRKRQIREMFAAFGYEVLELKRIRYAGLELADLLPGKWRLLSAKEIKLLERQVGLTG